MFKRRLTSRAAALVALGLLAACTATQPDYQKPQTELPESWGSTTGRAPIPANARWWSLFKDERLDKLVDEALANNANLAIALARVAEARAQLGTAEADLYPTVSAGFDRSRLQSSQRTGIPLPPGTPRERNDYRAALNASYEIDLWGRLHTAVEAEIGRAHV